jgi:hypothetical protein
MPSGWRVEGLTFHKNPFNMAKIQLIKDVGCKIEDGRLKG